MIFHQRQTYPCLLQKVEENDEYLTRNCIKCKFVVSETLSKTFDISFAMYIALYIHFTQNALICTNYKLTHTFPNISLNIKWPKINIVVF